MAKQPETVDRIVIMAEAPTLEMVGGGLAALTRLGFANVGYRLITDELKYKGRKVHEVSAEEFAAVFIKNNARFTSRDLVAHFREGGREPGAAYYAAKKLVEGNVIAKNGDGYVRVEALTAPKSTKTKTKTTTARGKQKPYDVPNIVLITRAIKGRKHITLVELRELFVREKRPEKSISPILTKLVGAKRLKALGNGEYDVLTPAAKKPSVTAKDKTRRERDRLRHKASRDAAKKAALNGGEAVAHG